MSLLCTFFCTVTGESSTQSSSLFTSIGFHTNMMRNGKNLEAFYAKKTPCFIWNAIRVISTLVLLCIRTVIPSLFSYLQTFVLSSYLGLRNRTHKLPMNCPGKRHQQLSFLSGCFRCSLTCFSIELSLY